MSNKITLIAFRNRTARHDGVNDDEYDREEELKEGPDVGYDFARKKESKRNLSIKLSTVLLFKRK